MSRVWAPRCKVRIVIRLSGAGRQEDAPTDRRLLGIERREQAVEQRKRDQAKHHAASGSAGASSASSDHLPPGLARCRFTLGRLAKCHRVVVASGDLAVTRL